MIPVILSSKQGRKGYSFPRFKSKFIEILKTHRRQKRALAFAFILYDFEHAEIPQVLANQNYWNALDDISGEYLTIFSFHAGKRRHEGYRFISRVATQDLKSANAFIMETFGVVVSGARPMILFFQVAQDGVSNPCIIELEEQQYEPAFNEIRDVLRDARDSISQVEEEYRQNSAEIFNLIVNRMRQRKGIRIVKQALRILISLDGLIEKLTGK